MVSRPFGVALRGQVENLQTDSLEREIRNHRTRLLILRFGAPRHDWVL